jgi:hypothetical protein
LGRGAKDLGADLLQVRTKIIDLFALSAASAK